MAANTHPGYRCPFCRARFVQSSGFRTGRDFHVRNYHAGEDAHRYFAIAPRERQIMFIIDKEKVN
jgi:hypothetical protein